MSRKIDWSLLIVIGSFVVCFLWFFHKPLFGEYDFIYRDAGRFYLPLYELIHDEWRDGRIPLWNSFDNSGAPLLANATASVFYPGKQIFLLPIEFEAKFKAYILLHVVFVAVSSFLVARFWKLSTAAAGLVALSYTFSGMVIFQFCNVVFLVSAGWLPWSLLFGERLLQKFSLRNLLGLSFSLAMMVLGGDPQMAYHVGLILGVRLLVMWWTKLPEPIGEVSDQPKNERLRLKAVGKKAGLLLSAALMAGGLAAVQILPTAEFGKHSVRATSEVPRNIWQVPRHWLNGHEPKPRPDTNQAPNWYDGLIGNAPPPAKHDLQIYSFSFAPIRIIEFLFPNITGSNMNGGTRWTTEYGWDSGNIWMPSVYFGLIPFLLTIFAFFIPCETRRTRWLKAVSMLALLASFGRYGLVWLMHLVAPPIGESPTPFGEAVGGLYWMLNVFLPAYSDFRFPAKWITVTMFGFTMLAGYGLDRLQDESLKKLLYRIVVSILGTASVILLVGVVSMYNSMRIEVVSAFAASVLHTIVLTTLFWFIYRTLVVGPGAQYLLPAIVALTTIELAFSNGGLIPVENRKHWQNESLAAKAIQKAEAKSVAADSSPVRFFRPFYFMPPLPETKSGVVHDVEVMKLERHVLGGYSHYEYELSMTFLYSTVVMNAYEAYFDPLAINEELAFSAPRMALDAWGTKYFILPKGDNYDDPKLSTLGLRSKWKPPAWQPGQLPIPWPINDELPVLFENGQFKVVLNQDRFPHAWMVRDVYVTEPIDPKDSARWVSLMQSIIYPNVERTDLRYTAIIEDGHDTDLHDRLYHVNTPTNDSIRVITYEPDRVVIEAEIERPGLLVVADAYYPGWKATVQTNDGEPQVSKIYRTNRMMRGIVLDSVGKHRITFRYQPWSFYLGAVISVLTTGGVLVVVIVTNVRRRRLSADDESSTTADTSAQV